MSIANVELDTTFDEWRVRTNQLIVQGDQIILSVGDLYGKSNSLFINSNNAFNRANAVYDHANIVFGQANAAYDQANLVFGQANAAYDQANLVFGHANLVFVQANTARTHANAAHLTANAAFNQANTARSLSNVATNIANGTAGAVPYQTGASTTAFISPGSSGQFLVSKGTNAPAWTDVIPAGTIMLFGQTSAPTGWTKLTVHNDKALRVVSGSVGSGGSISFSAAFTNRGASGTTSATGISGTTGATGVAAYTDYRQVSGSVNYHVLSWNEMPAHAHNITYGTNDVNGGGGQYPAYFNRTGLNKSSDSAGANWGHNHGFTGDYHQHYFDAGAHSHSFNAGSHTHTFSTSIDMSVQYVDVIMASKDAY